MTLPESASTINSPEDTAAMNSVLQVHRRWHDANVGFEIAGMMECFPYGRAFMMFNLNGFSYFGRNELSTLWQYLRRHSVEFRDLSTDILRYERRGDLAWIACQVRTTLKSLGSDSYKERVLRCTEIYHRESAAGSGEWRMWHFHCSDLRVGEPRPGFE